MSINVIISDGEASINVHKSTNDLEVGGSGEEGEGRKNREYEQVRGGGGWWCKGER